MLVTGLVPPAPVDVEQLRLAMAPFGSSRMLPRGAYLDDLSRWTALSDDLGTLERVGESGASPAEPPETADGPGARLGPLAATAAEAGAADLRLRLVRGEVDLYVHAGGQYEWDSAAPVAVALAAGLHASRIDASPLLYNQEDVLLPDLVVCRPELADRVLAAIEEVTG